MATNILTQVYTAQAVVYSSTISNVYNIDIAAILTPGSTGQLKYTIQRKTANSAWRNAKDENGNIIEFSTVNEAADGINIVGLNASSVRIKVEIISGAGTLNLEYESI